VGDDPVGEDRGEDPEHDQREADHADIGIEELAVETQPPLEGDRDREDDHQRRPDGQKLLGDAPR
jgi:hypothetical protein